MLSKYVEPGNKIEIFDAEYKLEEIVGYHSTVCEILSEDTMEIAMPMEKTKLVLLSVDMQYRLIIYTKKGLFQCEARVVDRYKSNNMYIAVMELFTELQKFQRREYYRLNCALDMNCRALSNEELDGLEGNAFCELDEKLPMQKGIMVDVSGGGMRFVTRIHYEKDSLLCVSFHLTISGTVTQYDVVGKVLAAREVENRRGFFEHRIVFLGIRERVREQIIKYIFQEERKNRGKNFYY